MSLKEAPISFPDPAYLHSAAALLAMAIVSILPKAEISFIDVRTADFSCRFTCDGPLDAHFLELITEKCRQWIFAGYAIETRKMLSSNASAYFEHRGLRVGEGLLSATSNSLLEIVNMADCLMPLRGPHLSNTAMLSHLQLLEFSTTPSFFQITGTVHTSKQELRALVHSLKQWKQKRHEVVGKALKLFDLERGVWLPKGIFLRQQLKRSIFELLERSGIDVVEWIGEVGEQEETALWMQVVQEEESFCEQGLLNSPVYETCRLIFPLEPDRLEEIAKRSLHLIQQTSTILGLRLNWVLALSHAEEEFSISRKFEQCVLSFLEMPLSAKEDLSTKEVHTALRLEAKARDALQQEWTVLELSVLVEKKRKGKAWKESSFKQKTWVELRLPMSLERVIALQVESEKEK